ncbi:winged helix-turn-helix transcriptional regulator [Salidesulfovibrio onnuriiensis]|uniref:winged helix-turn-helix transcriptional regulator n=1 Tax=Salidesulfovibrio onnuriiensis TaxID=2583823 RepID=UPI0011C8D1BF|nr:winged helix-turn-helix transcriptional regulator [Salidesulfovibrio onnuriiensis]
MAACGLKNLNGKSYYCTMELTLQIIGGKWKPIIIYHLGTDGVLRFSQFKKIMPNITQKMLTQQLRELEADGLVHREVYPQVPPKVEYSLTELGRSVMPNIRGLCEWGRMYEQAMAEDDSDQSAA